MSTFGDIGHKAPQVEGIVSGEEIEAAQNTAAPDDNFSAFSAGTLAHSPEETAVPPEYLERYRAALLKLDESSRLILEAVADGMTYGEIAQTINSAREKAFGSLREFPESAITAEDVRGLVVKARLALYEHMRASE